MKKQVTHFKREQGYFLFLAVVFIVVIGVMGVLISYMLGNRARLSVAQLNGYQSTYIAESGLEAGARLLTMPTLSGSPSRVSCAALTGTASVTNASMSTGTFTVTTINSSPIYAFSSLSGALTSSNTSLTLTSAASFAPSGRVVVDGEVIQYNSKSGNTLQSLIRGSAGTLASSHASGASVSQFQCSISSRAGIPSIASPAYQRELQWSIQLQNAWAVGARSGNVLTHVNWNRNTALSWTDVSVTGTSSNRANMNAVSLLTDADGWAVGDANGTNFTFTRWNGSAWTISQLAGACSAQHLLGISMVSATEGWAVGVRNTTTCRGSTYRYAILKWNGSAWSKLTSGIPADSSTNQNLNEVHVIDTDGDGVGNIGFAVGNSGRILQYNGSTWTVSSPTTQNLFGIYVVSASEAWAVGAAGVILKWNGSSWSSITSPTTVQLNSVFMIDTDGDGLANIGWGVGNSGRIVSYNGSTWSTTTSGTANLLSVTAFNSKDVWAVGASGTARHWDGSAWTLVSSATTRQLNGIAAVPGGGSSISEWKQVFR